VLNGVFTLDEVESMLLETAVAKATRQPVRRRRACSASPGPQLAYRLKRMKEADKQEKVPAPDEGRGRQAALRRRRHGESEMSADLRGRVLALLASTTS
jgi:hypothetical protein